MRLSISSLLLIIILLLCACSQEDWSPSSTSITKRLEAHEGEDGSLVVDSDVLRLSFVIPVADDYSFSLSDPSGLIWEGSLRPSGGFYTSEDLAIGPAACFMDGSYDWRLMNSRGEVESGTVRFSSERIEGDVQSLIRERNATLRTTDGAQVADDYTGPVTAAFRDRYSNTVTISYDLP